MDNFQQFELRRLSDELVYRFDRMQHAKGEIGYKRQDKDLWIVHRPRLGWVAWSFENEEVQGRPWHIVPEDQQANHPPEGEWVSKKGAKSYVYMLTYLSS